MLPEQRAREGVVGADHRLAGRFHSGGPAGAAQVQADAGQPGQPGSDAPQQLPGRLARERQSEHLARFGVAVGDQPHHSRGHRFGFAGAGSRDDDQRARRRGDDGFLLGRGRKNP